MPLTPEDVSNKRFTPVRLREGYDMGEVDQFLDEVEAELARLTRRTTTCARSSPRPSGGARRSARGQPAAGRRRPPEPAGRAEPSRRARAARGAAPQEIKVTTVAEASSAAARLLEIATRNADELVGEAKDEAEKIVGEARTKAERLESESKAKADRLESDARTRRRCSTPRPPSAAQQLFGDLEKEKDELNAEVENLRAFEREYRSRLKSYFQQQLAGARRQRRRRRARRRRRRPTHGRQRARALLGERAEPTRTARAASDAAVDAGPTGAGLVRVRAGQTRVTVNASPRSSSRTPGAVGRRRPRRSSVASTSPATRSRVLAQRLGRARRRPASCSAIRSVTSKPLVLRASWTSRTTSRASPARTQLRGELEVERDGLALLVDHRPALARASR